MNDTERIDALTKRLNLAKVLWTLLLGLVLFLFGAGAYFANKASEFTEVKLNAERALKDSQTALAEISSLKNQIVPGFTTSNVSEFVVDFPDLRKNLGNNRFCALTHVKNNTHTNSNCECGLSQDSQGWVLFLQNNQTDTACSCKANCIAP